MPETELSRKNDWMLESFTLTVLSVIFSTMINTAISPFVSSQGFLYRYLLAYLGMAACSSIALVLPLRIFEKHMHLASSIRFSRERLGKRVVLGVFAGLPIAGGWILSFIVNHKSIPTYVSVISIAEFRVELTTNFILLFVIYQFINQGMISVSEEILWRGFFQAKLQKSMGEIRGWLFASILFAVFHLFSAQYSVTQVLMEALPGGLIVGYLYLKTETLTAPISTHWACNIIERVVMFFLSF